MEKQLIFLDVDGTLCTSEGTVSERTKEAIQRAHENGHQFFLCTGRSKAELNEEVLSLPISGIIGAGGGYCEVDSKVVFHKVLDKDRLIDLVSFLKDHQVEYYLESNDGLFASTNLKNQLNEMTLRDNPDKGLAALDSITWFTDLLIEDESKIDYDHINKLSFVNQTIPFQEIYDRYSNAFQVIPTTVAAFGKESGEVGVKNIHKQTAIEYVLNYLNEDKAHTMAFGDGHNDVEMFAAVRYGIAMENAGDQLLAVADEVTTSNNSDGIAIALERHNLI
ncbi:HAD family hydrolase [Marinilactibacillus kalidii]|uniref:HAD family hydrolase n=1 Tax=Marinilactibacillus kalidii TaxID=2820274 RepID=UPI001ABEE34B|nr:HAD family hydrolase [Marinilactibacillus kalidii]